MPYCLRCGRGDEEAATHAFYYCEQVRPFRGPVGEWTASIDPKQLVMLDIDNVVLPSKGEKRKVFLAILAEARMVIWTMRKKKLYDGANFSDRDLIIFFMHLLRVRIRCDRQSLGRITFDKT